MTNLKGKVMNSYSADRVYDIDISEIRKIFDKTPEDSINLGLGEIQFPTPKIFTEYAREILQDGNIHYTPNAGLKELRQSIANYYENQINYENVCVTVGAEEAVFASIFCFINPGDEVLLANPTFVTYETFLKMTGGKAKYFDLDPDNNFSLDKNSFLEKITDKTKMVILTNPSNPLGITFSPEEIKFIVSTCSEKNILLLVNEIYRELYIHKKPSTMLDQYKNIIIISGISKSYCMTGWRLGWVVSKSKELITPIISAHQYICTCAPLISQKVAVKALSPEGVKAKENLRLLLLENRNYIINFLKENLTECKILINSSSPYLFVNFGIDDKKLCMDLVGGGVIVIPGSVFGSNGAGWIRISYGLKIEYLKAAMRKVYKILG